MYNINVVELKFNGDDVASSKTPIAVNDPKFNASAVYGGHFCVPLLCLAAMKGKEQPRSFLLSLYQPRFKKSALPLELVQQT